MRPLKGTYPDYLESYISKVKETEACEALLNNTKLLVEFMESIPEDKADFAYAEGKWTIKQLLIHICDAERIFSYRALRFGRGDDQKPLPFDENLYTDNCNAGKRSLESIINEIKAVRQSSILLFESFGEDELNKTGNTAIGTITVNSLAFAICGHAAHHVAVAKERYL
jgi:uncharacterized damage-inducible protein DinB